MNTPTVTITTTDDALRLVSTIDDEVIEILELKLASFSSTRMAKLTWEFIHNNTAGYIPR